MNALALDTSTRSLGLCLLAGDETRILITSAGLQHGRTLMPQIDRLLASANLAAVDIELIVCSIGPGSFTGIRIGLAAAKGLAMGGGCTLVGVSTLDALAHRFRLFEGVVVPVQPALRGRYYAAFYQGGIRRSDYLDLPLSVLVQRLITCDRLLLTGSAAGSLYRAIPGDAVGRCIIVDSGLPRTDPLSLLQLGKAAYEKNGGSIEGNIQPLYLRKSEAEINLYGE